MKRKQLQVLVDSVSLQVNYLVKFNIYNTVSQERAGPEKLVSVCNQGRAVNPRTPEHSGVEVPTPELFWGWILFWD